jgi:hypothetical protein
MRIETQVLKNKVFKTHEPEVYLNLFFNGMMWQCQVKEYKVECVGWVLNLVFLIINSL